MIAMYMRILGFIITIIIAYSAVIYFLPTTWEKIDNITGKTWNAGLTNTIDSLIGKAQDAQDSLENKLDNPAPNTSKKLEERYNSIQ